MKARLLGIASLTVCAALAAVAYAFPGKREQKPVQVRAPVDINAASAEDFARLPGIGPELARRIVVYQEKHGPFRRVEDLLAIRGIGHKKWKVLRRYLKVCGSVEKGSDGSKTSHDQVEPADSVPRRKSS